jgi:beta-lactamase regulating signal transducer with metallopeptidase domain
VIAVWMLYCIAIGCAFAIAGYALERGLRLAGRPMRWAWVVALVGSYLVPVGAWLRPEAFATFAAPVPAVVVPATAPAGSSTSPAAVATTATRSWSLSDFDAPLRWGWGLASVALLVTFAVAGIRLAAQRRAWRTSAIDGRLVLVSRDVGPAVVGVWQPRVVLPEWSLQLTPAERELILAHEEKHLRARDPWLLACGIIALMLAPWNVALWWQWRRLRLAVEMDCDARVIARGGSAPVYGALLLQVGRRRSQLVVGAPALGEPVSFLETRIRRMITALPRWRWAGAAVAIVVAAGAVVAACETPRPVIPGVLEAQQPSEVLIRSDGVNSADVKPLLTRYFGPNPRRLADSAVIVWFVVDQPGRVVAWGIAPRTPEDSVFFAPATAARVIPRYDTLRVEAVLVHAERGLPPTVVVRLGVRGKRLATPEPSPQNVIPSLPSQIQIEEIQTRGNQVRRLARELHPEVFGHTGPQTAVALVMDTRGNVLAHGASTREARAAGGRARNGETCLDVLTRLVPEYKDALWSQSGCADDGRQQNVVVYWGIPLVRLGR